MSGTSPRLPESKDKERIPTTDRLVDNRNLGCCYEITRRIEVPPYLSIIRHSLSLNKRS